MKLITRICHAFLIIFLIIFPACKRVKKNVHAIKNKSKSVVNESMEAIKNKIDAPPLEKFKERTKLAINDSIINLHYYNSYFPHEGEYCMVFTTTSLQIETWLSGPAPWNNVEWHKGPIPDYIFNCSFGFENDTSYLDIPDHEELSKKGSANEFILTI